MLFTIHIGDKLDLTKFRKQAEHYIATMSEVVFDMVLPHYRVRVEIAGMENTTKHTVTMWISSLERDQDQEIIQEWAIFPLSDVRFKDSQLIQELFEPGHHYKSFRDSSSVAQTVDKMCHIIKMVHKIQSLQAFV
jgi:hypothetical protein